MPSCITIPRTFSNGLSACSLGKLMLCCQSSVGGLLLWSLGQSLCRSRGCLTPGRFAASVMHLSSGACRPHAHQRASSSAGAAAAAAAITPACMSLPRACRGALASTQPGIPTDVSAQPPQAHAHMPGNYTGPKPNTLPSHACSSAAAAVLAVLLPLTSPLLFPSQPHSAFHTCAGRSQHQQQHPRSSSSVHLTSSA